jgi:hypothetical protein
MAIMSGQGERPERPRGRGGHGANPGANLGAMIAGIAALAIAAAAWFWLTRQPPQQQADIGLPHGVIVIGLGAFIAALVAQIRSMSVLEMLEALWDAFAWLIALAFGVALALVKAVWGWFLSLIGWD